MFIIVWINCTGWQSADEGRILLKKRLLGIVYFEPEHILVSWYVFFVAIYFVLLYTLVVWIMFYEIMSSL